MSAYETLSGVYDALTEDVGYVKRADFVEKLLRKNTPNVHTMLDLACGTGTMTAIFAQRGYEMIAVDQSEEMLAQAMCKTYHGIQPLFLHQSMPKLDLYDTVDCAICCLDSINYLTRPADVRRTFERLRLFISPGGTLVFDVNSLYKLRGLDGQVFLDETPDTYCVWRTEYSRRICTYYMDIFRRCANSWRRDFELHRQRAYTVEELTAWLEEAGFTDIRTYADGVLRAPREDDLRIYFSAIRR